jgi:magnesium transporter
VSASAEVTRDEVLTVEDLREIWSTCPASERLEAFSLAPQAAAEDFFLGLPARELCELLLELPSEEQRSWMRMLPPDDAADVIQHARVEKRSHLLGESA